jgi:hypothetical protein
VLALVLDTAGEEPIMTSNFMKTVPMVDASRVRSQFIIVILSKEPQCRKIQRREPTSPLPTQCR